MSLAFPAYTPPSRLYVNSVTGDDANAGTAGAPVATIERAVTLLGATGGTVLVSAPESDPLAPVMIDNPGPVVVDGINGRAWYVADTAGGSYALWLRGAGATTIRHANTSGGDNSCLIGHPNGVGPVVIEDSSAEGVDSGFATRYVFDTVDLTRCTGRGIANDGFNIHGDPGETSPVTLTDCIRNDCGDEGASPHDDCVLYIVGGEYRRNQQSGAAAVNNAAMHISGGEFTDNGAGVSQYGGVYWGDATNGSLDGGALCANNAGPGVYVDTTGTVTLGDYTSTGNDAPDDLT